MSFIINPFGFGIPGAPATGDLAVLLSADVEPTAGGAPHPFASTGVPTATPAGAHGRSYNSAATEGLVVLPTPSSVLSVGVRFRIAVNAAGVAKMIRFNGGGTDDHTEVQYVNGGGLRVVRNLSTVIGGPTAGGLISLNTDYDLEVTSVIHDTLGSFTVNLRDDSGNMIGGLPLTASGVDTRDAGTGNVTQVGFFDNGLDAHWEDVRIDTTGQLYGRCQVEMVAPNGAGALSQLTPSGAGSNYQQVDEIPCGTSDYNASTGADQYDSYVFPAIAISGTPQAAGAFAAVVASSGTPQFNFILYKGGVTYEHPTVYTSSATNKLYGGYWRNNPETGNAWASQAEINAFEPGIRMRAANCRVHGCYRATLIQL